MKEMKQYNVSCILLWLQRQYQALFLVYNIKVLNYLGTSQSTNNLTWDELTTKVIAL